MGGYCQGNCDDDAVRQTACAQLEIGQKARWICPQVDGSICIGAIPAKGGATGCWAPSDVDHQRPNASCPHPTWAAGRWPASRKPWATPLAQQALWRHRARACCSCDLGEACPSFSRSFSQSGRDTATLAGARRLIQRISRCPPRTPRARQASLPLRGESTTMCLRCRVQKSGLAFGKLAPARKIDT